MPTSWDMLLNYDPGQVSSYFPQTFPGRANDLSLVYREAAPPGTDLIAGVGAGLPMAIMGSISWPKFSRVVGQAAESALSKYKGHDVSESRLKAFINNPDSFERLKQFIENNPKLEDVNLKYKPYSKGMSLGSVDRDYTGAARSINITDYMARPNEVISRPYADPLYVATHEIGHLEHPAINRMKIPNARPVLGLNAALQEGIADSVATKLVGKMSPWAVTGGRYEPFDNYFMMGYNNAGNLLIDRLSGKYKSEQSLFELLQPFLLNIKPPRKYRIK